MQMNAFTNNDLVVEKRNSCTTILLYTVHLRDPLNVNMTIHTRHPAMAGIFLLAASGLFYLEER